MATRAMATRAMATHSMAAGLAGRSLARQYAEPVEVHRGDDRPARFVWRRRRYVVRNVLEHWVTTGAWWLGASGADPVPGGSLDDEWEFWRVEAAAGGSTIPAVVDLGFRWSTGEWIVQRLFD